MKATEAPAIPDPTANNHRPPVQRPALGLRPPQLPGWSAVAAAARLLRAPLDALQTLREAAAGHGHSRAVWAGGGHLHVAVHGVDPDRLDAFAADLKARAGRLPGVAWAALDTGCGRLVVAGASSAGPDEDAVLAAVEAAEAAAGASGPFAALVAEHPADRIGAARYTLEAAADVAAITAAVAGAVLRLPNQWLPVDPAAVIGHIQSQDRFRVPLERRFGATRIEAVLSVASAASHGLHQRTLAPAVDLVKRVLLVRQEDSRAATFAQVEPSLYATAPTARLPLQDRPAGRPVPPPGGPIERYADSALVATVAAALATVPLSGRTRDASNVLSAGVPKAARLGREAFAAGTAEFLGRCGVLVVRPESLRLLDRLDCLVIDPNVLATADFELGAVVPTADVPAEECRRRARMLLAAPVPGWELDPLGGNPTPGSPDHLHPAGDRLLSLRMAGRSVAVVELRPARRDRSPAAGCCCRRRIGGPPHPARQLRLHPRPRRWGHPRGRRPPPAGRARRRHRRHSRRTRARHRRLRHRRGAAP